MFPILPTRGNIVAETKFASRQAKCFLPNSETFDVSLCFSLMFPSVCPLWETWRNIGGIRGKQCFRNNREVKNPGFGVRVRVVSSCFTDVCNSIILFLFSCNRHNDIMRKMCTLITSKATDIDENIANQNHATRTRTPKLGYLNLSNVS